MDIADRPRPRRRAPAVRRAAAGPARHLDRAAPLATEPHGCRRDAHPQALPRGAAAGRLRADRARSGTDADSRRARSLGLRLGVERSALRRGRRHRRDLQTRAGARAPRDQVSPAPSRCASTTRKRRRRSRLVLADGIDRPGHARGARGRTLRRADQRRHGGLDRGVLARPRPRGLQITGDHGLAEHLLDGLAARSTREAAATAAA